MSENNNNKNNPKNNKKKLLNPLDINKKNLKLNDLNILDPSNNVFNFNNNNLNKNNINNLEKKNSLIPINRDISQNSIFPPKKYDPLKYQNKKSSFDDIFKKLDFKHYDEQLLMIKEDINVNPESKIMKTNKLIKFLDDEITKQRREEREIKQQSDKLLNYLLESSVKEYNSKYSFFDNKFKSSIYNDANDPLSYNNFKYNYLLKDSEEEKKKNEEELKIPKEKVEINREIDNVNDLIKLCNDYPLADNVEYNIDMTSLHKIKPSLEKLNNLIGMNSIKENIVDQILYFIQNLHNISPDGGDYMHTVIYGPPGTGKTEVAKIMGSIFSNLGVLKRNVFKKVTRDDLVAGYLGQTAMKTKDVIKDCLGGVLFIDEAYALGNNDKKDSFSKESIDTICEALSNYKGDFMCIIAGYKKELKDCFFSYNAGLESRFTWKFHIDDYTPSDLKQIFEKKVKDANWSLKEDLKIQWFEKNYEFFNFFGRDIETLFAKVKIAHSKRVFCLAKEEKTKISLVDLDKGLEIYLSNDDIKNRKDKRYFDEMIKNSLYC